MEQESAVRLSIEDYDELLSLWRRTGFHFVKLKGRDSRAAVARQLAGGNQTMLGIREDERLVGAVVATHDGRKGWINRLTVDPNRRRRGYGERLVHAAEEVLREQGIEVFAALVESDNAASLALFEKLGYADAGPRIHYVSKRPSPEA